MTRFELVMPAQAGIQSATNDWIPVLRSRGLWHGHGPKDQGTFAGMTMNA
jgi:hypothetical protein